MFYEERRDLIAENITTASGPFAVGPEFPYCFIASPKIQARVTIFAAAIDDSICHCFTYAKNWKYKFAP